MTPSKHYPLFVAADFYNSLSVEIRKEENFKLFTEKV